MDVQLKKRWDLIPPLVEVVKGYAAHEKEVFTRVIEAREDLFEGHINCFSVSCMRSIRRRLLTAKGGGGRGGILFSRG